MNRRPLQKIEKELEAIVRSPKGVRAKDLIRLANKLGRRKVIRGKEPTYEREAIVPGIRPFPLTIPGHPGDMAPPTAKGIARFLLKDVEEYYQVLAETGAEEVWSGDEDEEDGVR